MEILIWIWYSEIKDTKGRFFMLAFSRWPFASCLDRSSPVISLCGNGHDHQTQPWRTLQMTRRAVWENKSFLEIFLSILGVILYLWEKSGVSYHRYELIMISWALSSKSHWLVWKKPLDQVVKPPSTADVLTKRWAKRSENSRTPELGRTPVSQNTWVSSLNGDMGILGEFF